MSVKNKITCIVSFNLIFFFFSPEKVHCCFSLWRPNNSYNKFNIRTMILMFLHSCTMSRCWPSQIICQCGGQSMQWCGVVLKGNWSRFQIISMNWCKLKQVHFFRVWGASHWFLLNPWIKCILSHMMTAPLPVGLLCCLACLPRS